MPANFPIESVYLQPSFAGFNSPTLYKPGELGARAVSAANHQWQVVQLDSGATSATSIGVVAAGQLAYWKAQEGSYIVTNDLRFAIGGQTSSSSGARNNVAGVFTTAVTPGYYCAVQQGGPSETAVNILSSDTPSIGDILVSDDTANTAQGHSISSGTAPTCQIIGTITSAKVSNQVNAQLSIPGIP